MSLQIEWARLKAVRTTYLIALRRLLGAQRFARGPGPTSGPSKCDIRLAPGPEGKNTKANSSAPFFGNCTLVMCELYIHAFPFFRNLYFASWYRCGLGVVVRTSTLDICGFSIWGLLVSCRRDLVRGWDLSSDGAVLWISTSVMCEVSIRGSLVTKDCFFVGFRGSPQRRRSFFESDLANCEPWPWRSYLYGGMMLLFGTLL